MEPGLLGKVDDFPRGFVPVWACNTLVCRKAPYAVSLVGTGPTSLRGYLRFYSTELVLLLFTILDKLTMEVFQISSSSICINRYILERIYSRPPYPQGICFKTPNGWMPETSGSTKPCMYYVFPIHTYL